MFRKVFALALLVALFAALPMGGAAFLNFTVDIADGQTVSDTLELPRGARFGVVSLDAGFDGTTLTFRHSVVSSTSGFQTLYDTNDSPISWTVAASRDISPGDQTIHLVNLRWVRFVAGVAQTGLTTITIMVVTA